MRRFGWEADAYRLSTSLMYWSVVRGTIPVCVLDSLGLTSRSPRVRGPECEMWRSPFPKFLCRALASDSASWRPNPYGPSTAGLFEYRPQLEDAWSRKSNGTYVKTSCRSTPNLHKN